MLFLLQVLVFRRLTAVKPDVHSIIYHGKYVFARWFFLKKTTSLLSFNSCIEERISTGVLCMTSYASFLILPKPGAIATSCVTEFHKVITGCVWNNVMRKLIRVLGKNKQRSSPIWILLRRCEPSMACSAYTSRTYLWAHLHYPFKVVLYYFKQSRLLLKESWVL